MNPEQLRELIGSDPEALRLALAGSDDACAARVNQIAPKVLTGTLWSYRGLSAVLPLDVMDRLISSVDAHIESGAQFASVVREMREYLRKDGVDISNEGTQAMLRGWAASPLPLTPDDVYAIIEAVSVRPTISSVEITNLGLYQPKAES
jgi:hypothetical protein